MAEKYKKVYAVDFDGTLCRGTRFPKIGTPNFYLFEFLQQKQKEGDIIILWTCREKKLLEEAVEFCEKFGLRFDYINENTKENIEKYGNNTRKVFAHYYIDDKNMTINDLKVKEEGLDPVIWERACRISAEYMVQEKKDGKQHSKDHRKNYGNTEKVIISRQFAGIRTQGWQQGFQSEQK